MTDCQTAVIDGIAIKWGYAMPALTIRNLDTEIRDRLRVQAAKNGRSMEAEAREILRQAVQPKETGADLARRIHARFADLGGLEIELPEREPLGDPPVLKE